MKRINKVKQIGNIVLDNGNEYPLSPKVHIELDKKNKVSNKDILKKRLAKGELSIEEFRTLIDEL